MRSFSSRTTAQLPVILSSSRTPVGSFNGSLSSFTAPELGAFTIEESIKRAGISPSVINEVYMGNVISAGVGQAPARQAALKAGVSESAGCTTVNKVCASGMKAVIFAAQSVMSGVNDVVVAGGMESMSNIPYYLPKARTGLRLGHGQVIDGILSDGLLDAYDGSHMGVGAEACATRHGFTREEQDTFCLNSYQRAIDATKAKLYQKEIVQIEVKSKKGSVMVEEDEEIFKLNTAKVPDLKSPFVPGGSVTAANASSLNDGAASLVLASAEFAAEGKHTPVARVLGMADTARTPVEFTEAPADAIRKALAMAELKLEDVDVFEINEAFSVVSLANMKLLDLDPETVNINGGAVAIGHPIGCSGARIIVTLLHVLEQQNKRYGVAAICNGGGGASAVVVERL